MWEWVWKIAGWALSVYPVSYTHLDVYKRQHLLLTFFFSCTSSLTFISRKIIHHAYSSSVNADSVPNLSGEIDQINFIYWESRRAGGGRCTVALTRLQLLYGTNPITTIVASDKPIILFHVHMCIQCYIRCTLQLIGRARRVLSFNSTVCHSSDYVSLYLPCLLYTSRCV